MLFHSFIRKNTECLLTIVHRANVIFNFNHNNMILSFRDENTTAPLSSIIIDLKLNMTFLLKFIEEEG